MKRKIGVMLDNLKLPTRKAVEKAREIGADGFQLYVIKGDTAPENMSKEDRKAFVQFVKSQKLEISALCGDMGLGFLDRKTNPQVVARSRLFVDLAVDLGTRIVTTHIGYLPEDERAPEWEIGLEAVTEVARYAESRGCVFASETGPEPPTMLKRFLDKVPSKGMRVNYDPANFIMLGPFDHIGGVKVLADYIVHTHAKDGVCLMKHEGEGKNEYLETPLGEGSVAFPHYLKALDAIGYQGYLTIEREVGADPVADVAKAVKFLRSLG